MEKYTNNLKDKQKIMIEKIVMDIEYIKSPFPYAGCKYNLLSELDKYIPSGDTFLDLFAGSGVVSLNLAHKFKKVYCNDILKPLMYMHKNFRDNDLDDILNKAKQYSSSDPNKYAQLRNEFNKFSGIYTEYGYRYYGLLLSCTNNLARFNKKGEFNQTCGKRQLTEQKIKEIKIWKEKLDTIKKKNIFLTFTNFNYEDILIELIKVQDKIPSDLVIYADPPYSNTAAGYNNQWTIDDDKKLAELIINHSQYKFCISSCIKDNNKTMLIEKLIDSRKFNIYSIPYNYKASKKTRNQTTEELIFVSKNLQK